MVGSGGSPGSAISTVVAGSSGTGTQAASSIANMGTGIQSSFEVSGSSDSSKNESFALKERRGSSDSAVVYSGYDEISYSDVTTSHSDVHLRVSLGTEATGIGFSINQSQSSVIKSTSIQYDDAVPGSDPPAGVETHYFTTMHSVKGEEESSSGFGIALGSDATGTAADDLQSEGSYSAFSEIDSWQISRIENYLNVPGDVYRWAQLDYERHEVEAGSDSDAVGGSAELHWAGMTDSLPARPAVVLTALPAEKHQRKASKGSKHQRGQKHQRKASKASKGSGLFVLIFFWMFWEANLWSASWTHG